MKRIVSILICFFVFFVFHPRNSAAQISYPEKKQEYVNDFVSVLGDAGILENKLKDFEKGTSNKINIAILHSIEDIAIEKYADKLYEKWRVGKDKDNGVLILVLLKDKKIYIKVGYGLLDSLSSSVNQDIINNEVNPSFQEGMYLEGLDKGSNAIMSTILGKYKKEEKKNNNYSSIIFVVILVTIFVFLFIFSNIKSKRKKGINNLKKIRNI